MSEDNIIKYERVSREEVKKIYEERREAFFQEYGTSPREGESEEISLFRKWFQTDTLAAIEGGIRENIPAASKETADEFTLRREAAEYARFVSIMNELDRLSSRQNWKEKLEQIERYEACEKRLQEKEARGEDTSDCYFAGAEYEEAIEKAFQRRVKG